jgi:CRISPR-associated protein Cas1
VAGQLDDILTDENLELAWNRVSHRPQNAGNSMLSFAYSILHQNAVTALKLEGLDVRLGFLHQSRGNFAALVCGLMEEFRAPVADRFVLEFASAGEARRPTFSVLTADAG